MYPIISNYGTVNNSIFSEVAENIVLKQLMKHYQDSNLIIRLSVFIQRGIQL